MIPDYSDAGDMSAHEMMIYCVIRGIKPQAILEIGIRSGVSTLAICRALEDASLHNIADYNCCDIDESCVNVKRKTTVPLNFHIMSSDKLAEKWDKGLDILFIDGYHEYSQVKRDYFNFSKFVKPNGFIFLHDTYPPSKKYTTRSYCWDAYKILGDLKKDGSIEFVTFPYSFGLTVCRKL